MSKLIGYQVTDTVTQDITGLPSWEILSAELLVLILEKLDDRARHRVVVVPIYEDTIEEASMVTDLTTADYFSKLINRNYMVKGE